MKEEDLRAIIEQIDPNGNWNNDQVEDFIAAAKEKKPNLDVVITDTEEQLRAHMLAETDWRKRASIAAKIISLKL